MKLLLLLTVLSAALLAILLLLPPLPNEYLWPAGALVAVLMSSMVLIVVMIAGTVARARQGSDTEAADTEPSASGAAVEIYQAKSPMTLGEVALVGLGSFAVGWLTFHSLPGSPEQSDVTFWIALAVAGVVVFVLTWRGRERLRRYSAASVNSERVPESQLNPPAVQGTRKLPLRLRLMLALVNLIVSVTAALAAGAVSTIIARTFFSMPAHEISRMSSSIAIAVGSMVMCFLAEWFLPLADRRR